MTGGTGGIGSTCVELFAKRGYGVEFTYFRSRAAAFRIVAKCRPGKARMWKVDLSSDEDMQRFVAELRACVPRLNALVMCQGIIAGKSLDGYSHTQIDRVFAVNAISIVKLTRMLRPVMSRNSTIVYMASISAFAGSYDAVYAASKGAIVSFMKSVAKEYGPQIRVNAIAPGLTRDTGMYGSMKREIRSKHLNATILNRLASPLDVANVALFLSSDDSRHMTGTCLDVNGGEYLR